jgi:hypothetical protein
VDHDFYTAYTAQDQRTFHLLKFKENIQQK